MSTRTSDDTLQQRLGWFRYHFEDGRWEWSPQVEALHGYQPGTVVPTTALVLSHKHPEDYNQVSATLDDVRRHRRAFSSNHRIIDTHGQIHHVLVVADTVADDSGMVVGTYGFYVDITPVQQQITAAVAEIAESRAVIDQAKGILMFVYGIDADAAFGLIRWQSQEHNVKLRRIAEAIVDVFVRETRTNPLANRFTYDNLLLNIHLDIAGPASTHGAAPGRTRQTG